MEDKEYLLKATGLNNSVASSYYSTSELEELLEFKNKGYNISLCKIVRLPHLFTLYREGIMFMHLPYFRKLTPDFNEQLLMYYKFYANGLDTSIFNQPKHLAIPTLRKILTNTKSYSQETLKVLLTLNSDEEQQNYLSWTDTDVPDIIIRAELLGVECSSNSKELLELYFKVFDTYKGFGVAMAKNANKLRDLLKLCEVAKIRDLSYLKLLDYSLNQVLFGYYHIFKELPEDKYKTTQLTLQDALVLKGILEDTDEHRRPRLILTELAYYNKDIDYTKYFEFKDWLTLGESSGISSQNLFTLIAFGVDPCMIYSLGYTNKELQEVLQGCTHGIPTEFRIECANKYLWYWERLRL